MWRRMCRMLHFATCHLAVGGRLVFYTYSMNPIENEAVIATLLTQQKGFCWFHCSYVFCRSCVVCLSVSSITLKVVEQFSRNYVRGVGVGTKTLSIRLRDNLDPHPAMLPARGNNQWASAVFGHNTWVLPSVCGFYHLCFWLWFCPSAKMIVLPIKTKIFLNGLIYHPIIFLTLKGHRART